LPELDIQLKIEQKHGTSLDKLVLSRRKSASRLKTVQRLSVLVIYFHITTWFGGEPANPVKMDIGHPVSKSKFRTLVKVN
jgi:hypothetical protein